VSHDVTRWTLRDAQHNSFPFVQPKGALCSVDADDPRLQVALDRRTGKRWSAMLQVARESKVDAVRTTGWPGPSLLRRLAERKEQFARLYGTEAGAMPLAIERFLRACDPACGGDPVRFVTELLSALVAELEETAGEDLLDVTAALLLEGKGAMIIDAAGVELSILDPRILPAVSDALYASNAERESAGGLCGLTGVVAPLLDGPAPQPNLPVLGQTFLLARNKDTPANARYGRTASETMPVARDAVDRLAAAIDAMTAPELKGRTWRAIPGEVPKQQDLLLAMVDGAVGAEVADLLAEDEGDGSGEDESTAPDAGQQRRAEFLKRCERVVEMVRAAVPANFQDRSVRLVVLRTLDPANRKVVHSSLPTVGELHAAVRRWVDGERNLPPWLNAAIPRRGVPGLHVVAPPHVAPLGLIAFSRVSFRRDGIGLQEAPGIPASEALSLMLEATGPGSRTASLRARRILRLVLERRSSLCIQLAHATRCDPRDPRDRKEYNGFEYLRTASVLGLLLHKLGHDATGNDYQGGYMNGMAFELGQLLAAADAIHAGYCADLRSGDTPPSLLGNQVFGIAQSSPVRALAVLGRRWKPYQAWAGRSTQVWGRAHALIEGGATSRGWNIRVALRNARDVQPLAAKLFAALPEMKSQRVGDDYRAMLLLGYMAGLPKPQDDEEGKSPASTTSITEEN